MKTIIIFSDMHGNIFELDSDLPNKFAKKEAENYLYDLGYDAPVVNLISVCDDISDRIYDIEMFSNLKNKK